MNQISTLILCVFFVGVSFTTDAQSCNQPTNLHVTSYSSSTLSLGWSGGGASHWQLRYAPLYTSVWTAPTIALSDSSIALSGLQPNTYYGVIVRDSCGVGNVSSWTILTYFKTSCPNITTASTEDFEGPAWVPFTLNTPGYLDSCWNRNQHSGLLVWTTTQGGDHTTGNGKFVRLRHFGTYPGRASLETPLYDLSGISKPQMAFWSRMNGGNSEDLKIYVSIDSGATYSLLAKFHGPQQFTSGASWKESVVRLDSFANDVVRIKFEVIEKSQSYSDYAIDDFRIRPRPSCPRPENFELVKTGSYSATFDWDSLVVSSWQMQYNTTGFSLGAGLKITGTAIPGKLTGLSPNTTYDVYLRDSCGPADKSPWIGPITFTTRCAPVSTPYVENFNGANWPTSYPTSIGVIDNCWRRPHPNERFVWKGNRNFLFTSIHSIYPDSIVQTVIETVPIDLSNLTLPYLTFFEFMNGADIDSLEVLIDDGSGFSSIHVEVGEQQQSANEPWKEVNILLPAYANDTVVLRFVATRIGTGTNANFAIDDLSIDEAPTCFESTNLSVDSLTANSALMSWTGGGSSNWQIAFQDTFQNTGFIIVSANSSPFWLSNLTANTTYEVMVRDSCGPGDVSLWSQPVVLTTPCGYIEFPHLENFDGPEWVKGNSSENANNQISSCWYRASDSNPNFGPFSSYTGSSGTGPSSDYSGNGKYLYTEASSGAVGAGKINMPPVVVPDSSENPYLKFAYHMYGNNIHSLKVKIDDGKGLGLVNVYQLNGQQQDSSNAPWKFDSISLKDYALDTITIQFIGRNTGYSGDVAIDEVALKFCSPVKAGITTQSQFLKVVFDTAATAGASNFIWDFGNGHTDSIASPIYNYDSAGTYQVALYSYNNCGKGDTAYKTIIVCDTLAAGFNTYTNGDTLFYSADSSNNANGFDWNLDEGRTSANAKSYVVYDSTGFKTISLTTYNQCGDTASYLQTIPVCPKPIARWTYDTLAPIGTGLRLQFNAMKSRYANNYDWDFGDGQTGSGPNPIHTYTTASFHYEVTLVVSNGCGTTDTLKSRLRYIGLEEWSNREDLRLFPNPAHDAVTLLWRNGIPKIENITLINSLGQAIPIGIETSEKNKVIISLNGFAEGYYLLRIQTGQGLHTKRLIILH